jgi:NAD(P)-dependent dehydrogenase (short-subunit alcohol dehydrogenase family)
VNLADLTSGRRVLITGASAGLGAHFAQTLAMCGAKLAVAARRLDRLEEVARECRRRGAGAVLSVELDVAAEESVATAFSQVTAAFGGLDVLINNAGVTHVENAIDISVVDYDRVLDTNLRGAWLCSAAAAPLMIQSGGGDIVNIASILGIRVAGKVAPYAISKAGLIEMTRTLARQWARDGIRVNALAPGYVATDLNADFFATPAGIELIGRTPMGRLARMDELDPPLLLLASGASRYLTGAVITVDGAHHIFED